jgi:microcompartment protein CcmK/EutM
MRIGRVVGNVVSTIKDEDYYGYKLMIVEYWDENGKPDGSRVIAFDAGQAGIGDVVLIAADGGAANMLLNDKKIVADVAIAGVLDCYTYEGETHSFH